MQSYQTLIFILLSLIISNSLISAEYRNDSAANQLPSFVWRNPYPIGMLTTSFGAPVAYHDTQTINTRLLLNDFFVESMTHFPRERIPERVVHGKGTGAFGYFKVTHDLSDICKAKLFDTVGKKTSVVVRFSLGTQRAGASDLARDIRGMAVKFYSEEGNFDYVGITTEMFQIKDPILLPSFVHASQKNPVSQVTDVNSMWDFMTLRPESLLLAMRIFGDRGIPDGYRFIPSFTIHTFELLNELGERTFARFHLLPDLGYRNLTSAEAARIQGQDLDYANRDLYNAIAEGNFPTWTLYVQTVPESDITKVKFDIFDVTRYWPVDTFPLRPIGVLTLNRNPKNQFADIEQLAFNPGHLVPGIRGVDTLFEARVLTYREANIHRLGANFNKIRVNYPMRTVPRTYMRDGKPPVADNEKDTPNYYPNSFHGPIPTKDYIPSPTAVFTDPNVNNFDQAAELYDKLSKGERCRLVENIVESLNGAAPFIQERAVKLYKLIHTEMAKMIEHNLHLKKKYPNEKLTCDVQNKTSKR